MLIAYIYQGVKTYIDTTKKSPTYNWKNALHGLTDRVVSIMQRAGKSFVELTLEDFIYHDPGLTNIEELFEDQFSKLFKIYIYKRRQNDYNEFLNYKGRGSEPLSFASCQLPVAS